MTLLDTLNFDLNDGIITAQTNLFDFGEHGGGCYAIIAKHPTEANRCYVVDWLGGREGLIEMWQHHAKHEGNENHKEWYAVRFHRTTKSTHKNLQVVEILLWGFWNATEGW